jgi:uncharacterized cupredoxin-like copper-binding protein
MRASPAAHVWPGVCSAVTRRHRIAALCLTVPAIASGCGSSSDADSASTAAAKPADGTITVNLTEYKITATPDTAPAGRVMFDVANAGAIPHEFVVLKTDTPADKLLTGNRADESGSVGELSEKVLTVGAKKDLTLDLKRGHYALICNLPGHYQGGMHLDFTVK